MARAKKLVSPLSRTCSLTFRGELTLIENEKIDIFDYVGSTENCDNHLAILDFHENKEETLEDLHSYEKNRNTQNYVSSPKKKKAISRHSLVPFFFLSCEHIKFYLADKIFRIILSILKTVLSSFFRNLYNSKTIIKKKNK